MATEDSGQARQSTSVPQGGVTGDGRTWMLLLVVPVAEVVGAWAFMKMGPDQHGYSLAAIFLVLALTASVGACLFSAARLDAGKNALLTSIASTVTLFGLAPLVFLDYMVVVSGSLASTLFFGPFALLVGIYMAVIMAPWLVLLPMMGLVWGVVCAFGLWRAGRLTPLAAVVCGALLFVPGIGLVSLVVMLVKGWRGRTR